MIKRDLLGQKFGHLTVLSRAGSNAHQKALWRCRCDCGGSVAVTTGHLRSGNTRSCGCQKVTVAKRNFTKHGGVGTRAYQTWTNMLRRCRDPKCPGYRNYGGRGIVVCERWLDFANFFVDMGERPRGMTLDRIDNDGGYEPTNCRWATRKQQSENSRRPVLLTFGGITKNKSQWAAELGIHPVTLIERLQRGWPLEQALSLPKQHRWSGRARRAPQ